MNKFNIVCNNCGLRGHIYKDCKAPITSYGIILYKIEDSNPYILMIQRKDSLCYIEFLRGKYDIYNLNYIQILIDKCSLSEKENLITKEFDTLWKELWILNSIDENKYSNDYIKGKTKFNKIKEGFQYNKLNTFIDLNYFVKQSTTNYLTSEWEFPKGRRNNMESNKDCAIREFKEETNYNLDDYELLINLSPLIEQYTGENKVRYKHIYYIGYLKNIEKETKVDKNNKDQLSEIKDISWLDKGTALKKIRDYHSTREKVIQNIFGFILSLGNYKIL